MNDHPPTQPNPEQPDDDRLHVGDPWIMRAMTQTPLPSPERLSRTVMTTASNVKWIFALTILNLALTLYCAVAVHEAETFVQQLRTLVP